MISDHTLETGPLFGAIGEAIFALADFSPSPIWAYFEVGAGWQSGDIVIDRGGYAEWIFGNAAVVDAVYAVWDAEPFEKRWSGLEYVIRDKRFRAKLLYSDQLDATLHSSQRGKLMLKQHFGNKEVRYPAL